MLDKCHTFNFSESYAFADKVRKAIFEDQYIIEPVETASNIENQIKKPQKQTLLHDYIKYVVEDDLTFYFRGPGWEYSEIEPVLTMLDSHGVTYSSLDQYIKDLYRDDDTGITIEVTEGLEEKYRFEHAEYIESLLPEVLTPIIVAEVFTLLFSDREAMKAFNLKIASYLGVKTARCTYWPKWLERALFCREKGLCALCKCDLSSIYHTQGKLAVDHIVPIALFGVNDPTNLQILCERCNGKKSGSEIITSNALPLFW